MFHIPTPIGFLIIGVYLVPILWFGTRAYNATSASYQQMAESPDVTAPTSSSEKAAIESWIAANNLNEFGDPQGTVYAGGTPLVDEVTGKKIDKYTYIVEKHPDKPWGK